MKLYFKGNINGNIQYSLDGETFLDASLSDLKNGIVLPDDIDFSKIKVKGKSKILSNLDVLKNIEYTFKDNMFYAFTLDEKITSADLNNEIMKGRLLSSSADTLPIVYCEVPYIDEDTSKLYVIDTYKEKGHTYGLEFDECLNVRDSDYDASFFSFVKNKFKRSPEYDIKNPFKMCSSWYTFSKRTSLEGGTYKDDFVYASLDTLKSLEKNLELYGAYGCYFAKVVDVDHNKNFENCSKLNEFKQKVLKIYDASENLQECLNLFTDGDIPEYIQDTVELGFNFTNLRYSRFRNDKERLSRIYIPSDTVHLFQMLSDGNENKYLHFKNDDTTKAPDFMVEFYWYPRSGWSFSIIEHPLEKELNEIGKLNSKFIELPSVLYRHGENIYFSDENNYIRLEQDGTRGATSTYPSGVVIIEKHVADTPFKNYRNMSPCYLCAFSSPDEYDRYY